MRPCGLVAAVLLTSALVAQQLPFIPVSGINAPAGVRKIFEDSHGGLGLAGNGAADVLRYFDGRRFITPFTGSFPQVLVNCMAEDSEGGIWRGTTAGIYRLFQGRLQKFYDGFAGWGITAISPNVFLINVRSMNSSAANVIRISKGTRGSTFEPLTKLWGDGDEQISLDHSANILYSCEGGFCEAAIDDIKHWHPDVQLRLIRHRPNATSRGATACGLSGRLALPGN